MAKTKARIEDPIEDVAAILTEASRSRVLVVVDEVGRDRRTVADLTGGFKGVSLTCPKCGEQCDLLIISKHGQGPSATACEYECSGCRSHGTLYT